MKMLLGFSIFNKINIFTPENYFLIAVALIWIVGAVVQDLRKREVANWWNFSLVAVALSYRAFLSVYLLNYWYFVYGVAGFGAGFGLANLFYYSRIFAGGDAKLLMGLGAVLPLSLSWLTNLKIILVFCGLLLVFGSVYSLIYSFVLISLNWKKFSRQFVELTKSYAKLFYLCFGFAFFFFLIAVLFLKESLFIYSVFLILLFPVLFVYARAVEEACMLKRVRVKDLTIGDWLAEEIVFGRKKIKPNWEGLSEDELKLIQKKYKGRVLVKQGIPFTPAFLFALAGLI